MNKLCYSNSAESCAHAQGTAAVTRRGRKLTINYGPTGTPENPYGCCSRFYYPVDVVNPGILCTDCGEDYICFSSNPLDPPFLTLHAAQFSGLQYQWQSYADNCTGYTDISGATDDYYEIQNLFPRCGGGYSLVTRFRVKITDGTAGAGCTSYSNEEVVWYNPYCRMEGKDNDNIIIPELLVYPNPNTGSFTLNVNGINGNATVEISDQLSREVYKELIDFSNGQSYIRLNKNLSNGLYTVRVISNQKIFTSKLLLNED